MEGGEREDGYVALDNFVFEHRTDCPSFPHFAVPGYSTTTPGPTQPAFPSCDFEEGDCGWVAADGPVHWTRTDDSQLAANNQTIPAPGHGESAVCKQFRAICTARHAIDKNIAMNMMEENKNYLTFTFLLLKNLYINLGQFIFKCIT